MQRLSNYISVHLVDLPVNSDLHAEVARATGVYNVDVVVRGYEAFLALVDRALAIGIPIVARLVRAHLADGVSLAGVAAKLAVDVEHVRRDGCGVACRDDVRRSAGTGRRCSVRGSCEGTALDERSTDREDDTERHGRGQNSGHRGDDGLDCVCVIGRLSDEPEKHVDHVHDPDRAVKVKAITEHELPERKWLGLERLEGTV